MIELEKTYLIKFLPQGLKNCKCSEIIDIYIPKSSLHPVLRIRENGSSFEMTKKQPVQGRDSSRQLEQTIVLSEREFKELEKVNGKRLHKIRFYYPYKGKTAEIDVFRGELKGLVLVDVEFKTIEEKGSFRMPDFCLADVTQEKAFAGGMLCGKLYKDIEKELKKFRYSRLFLD